MSQAIGIDLGTTYSCVGVWQHDRVEIISNDQGNRTTPSYVAFTDDERLIGDAAKNQTAMNPKNTVFDAKRLIGRKFSDKKVQDDMKDWSYEVVAGPGDKPMINVESHGEKKTFSPEFLNRIDDVVIFNTLEKDDLAKIISLELAALQGRVKELGYTLELTDNAVGFLIDKGYDKQFGARPLARAIQRYVEDKLAGEIISNTLSNGANVTFDWDKKGEELTLKIKDVKKSKKS